MKKMRFLAVLLSSLLALSLLAGCANTGDGEDTSPDSDNTETTDGDQVPVYIPEPRPYTRPEETYEGVQGIMLRCAASEVDTSVISGTQVTDCILDNDGSDFSAVISALDEAQINAWVSVPVAVYDGTALGEVNALLDANDLDGIELDFSVGQPEDAHFYSDLDTITQLIKDVKAAVDAKEAAAGHDILLAVKVYSDVATSYDFGLDVSYWISANLIDMVCPSSGSEYSDTDMAIRLWASLADPRGVIVAPVIAPRIRNYSYGTMMIDQTVDTLAGEAAVMISQGADRVSLYDYLDVSVLNTIGSYSTVMVAQRTHYVTFNPTHAAWVGSTYDDQLPKTFNGSNNAAVRIPMGNVPEGATVVLRINYTGKPSLQSTVYANSEKCTLIGEVPDMDKTIDYSVPLEAQDAGYVLFEIMPAQSSHSVRSACVIVSMPTE